MEEVNTILRMYGITTKYKGFNYINDAIEIMDNQYNIGNYIEFNRSIYQIIADKYNTSVETINKNIKTVIERCIANNRTLSETILGYQIYKSPTNADFLERLLIYIIDIRGK